MTAMTPKELLHAFSEGLEEASRNARQQASSQKQSPRGVVQSSTARIVGNTLVGTLRKTYGDKFAVGYRSDTTLKALLEREGFQNLTQFVRARSTYEKGRR